MKVLDIPDEFFGALLGAWLATVPAIWALGWWIPLILLICLSMTAFLLSVIDSCYEGITRRDRIFCAALSIVMVPAVLGIYAALGVAIFDAAQLIFFILLISCWVLLGLVEGFINLKYRRKGIK